MPVNKTLMDSLQKQYGKKGTSVYYGLENSGKKSFAKGLKTASKEGHTAKDLKAYKKSTKKPKKK